MDTVYINSTTKQDFEALVDPILDELSKNATGPFAIIYEPLNQRITIKHEDPDLSALEVVVEDEKQDTSFFEKFMIWIKG